VLRIVGYLTHYVLHPTSSPVNLISVVGIYFLMYQIHTKLVFIISKF